MTLGKGVYNNYGIANNGFNISSIQFAIHYMFENELIFKEFINNVAECTALNGYFIGTCYDGIKVFKKLSSIEMNKSISLIKNDVKIWEVTKKYSFDEYNDEDCFGYGIDVYQESINKTFREYLVNFDYLTRVLENYGFVLLTKDELKTIMTDVIHFEPHIALTDSVDGLTFYRRYAKLCEHLLTDNGIILLEVGLGNHCAKVEKIFREEGYNNIKRYKDFNDDERVLLVRL